MLSDCKVAICIHVYQTFEITDNQIERHDIFIHMSDDEFLSVVNEFILNGYYSIE